MALTKALILGMIKVTFTYETKNLSEILRDIRYTQKCLRYACRHEETQIYNVFKCKKSCQCAKDYYQEKLDEETCALEVEEKEVKS